MFLASNTDAAVPRGVIQQEGEVILREAFAGVIHCDRLILEAGAQVDAEVRVDELDVKAGARLNGPVEAGRARIHEGGEFTGEIRADRLTSKGSIVGIVIAGLAQAARTASFQGFIIAESYGSEIGASVRGSMRASPGQTAQIVSIDRDRDRVVQGGILKPDEVWTTPSRSYSAPETPARTVVEVAPEVSAPMTAAPAPELSPVPDLSEPITLPRLPLRAAAPAEPRTLPEVQALPLPVAFEAAQPVRADDYRPRLI